MCVCTEYDYTFHIFCSKMLLCRRNCNKPVWCRTKVDNMIINIIVMWKKGVQWEQGQGKKSSKSYDGLHVSSCHVGFYWHVSCTSSCTQQLRKYMGTKEACRQKFPCIPCNDHPGVREAEVRMSQSDSQMAKWAATNPLLREMKENKTCLRWRHGWPDVPVWRCEECARDIRLQL